MKKYLFYLMAFFAIYGCQNEEEFASSSEKGLKTSAEFLKLTDNDTNIAGVLKLSTDVSEVKLKWNITESSNLDTTLTSVSVANGVAEVPVKWLVKGLDGNYGPPDVAFRAGVLVTAGEESQYVPLIWADKIDSVKVRKLITPVTRSGNASLQESIEVKFLPKTLNLSDTKGGTMRVQLSNTDFAIMDYSEFNASMNLDLNSLPDVLENSSTILRFNWAPAPPATGFTAKLHVMTEEIIESAVVSYIPGNIGTLTVDPLDEKLPVAGGENIASTIVVTDQDSWSATSNQTWLRIQPSTGVGGNSSIYFSADPNPYSSERVATVKVTAGMLSQSITITQLGLSSSANLEYLRSTPTGDLPATESLYTAIFSGSYSGNIQIRALSNNIVLNTGAAVTFPDNQPTVKVPANTNTASRPLTFEYSTGTGWLPLPAAASRVQKGSSSSTVNPDGGNTGLNDWGNGDNINGGQIQL